MNISEADLEFGDSFITVFYGENGAGKSAVIESFAICFTERRRGDSYKDFIKHGETIATIDMEATFQGDPVTFSIELVNKKGVTPFKRIIEYKGIKYKNSECTPLLDSFGLDYLQHIMFSLQGESNITDLKPAERTKLLKRIFDFELKPQIDSLENMISSDQQNLLVLQTQHDTLKQREFTYQEEGEELSAVQIKRYEMSLEGKEREIKEIEKRYYQYESIKKELDTAKDAIDDTQKKLTEAQNTKADLERSLISFHSDLGEYNARIAGIENEVSINLKIDEKQKEIDALKLLVEQKSSEANDKADIISEMHANILELTNHIAAHQKGKCPSCGQDTKPESVPGMIETKANAEANKATATAEKNALDQARVVAEKTINNLESEITALRNSITTNASLVSQYEGLLTRTNKSIEDTIALIEEKKKLIVSLMKKKAEKEDEWAMINDKIVVDDAEKNDALYTERDSIKQKLRDNEIQVELNKNIRTQNEKLKKEEESVAAQIILLNKQQNEVSGQLTAYREAKRILSVELPNYIIVKACANLEKYINAFISNVKDGMSVRLQQSKRGVDFFYSPTGVVTDDWMSTQMASGFEKELLSAAWRVALAKAYHLYTLMLDEIDSAASIQASEQMFRNLANLEEFDQLFIISHKRETVDILKSENDNVRAYLVEKGEFTLQSY